MKRAVSVSLGSSTRDKKVVVDFNGEMVSIERIGTDGDAEKAKRLFGDLDGKVDALAVGGADLYYRLGGREYPARAVLKLIEDVHQSAPLDSFWDVQRLNGSAASCSVSLVSLDCSDTRNLTLTQANLNLFARFFDLLPEAGRLMLIMCEA